MSNLVVKMMSGESLADSNQSKGFTLVEAYGEVRCVRDLDDKPRIEIPLESGQVAMYHPEGNTYLLKNGKTVATFNYQLQSDVTVKAIEMIKSNNSDWQHYSDGSLIVVTNEQLNTATFESKFTLILDSVLEKASNNALRNLGLSFVVSVLNPDTSDKFHVYRNTILSEGPAL